MHIHTYIYTYVCMPHQPTNGRFGGLLQRKDETENANFFRLLRCKFWVKLILITSDGLTMKTQGFVLAMLRHSLIHNKYPQYVCYIVQYHTNNNNKKKYTKLRFAILTQTWEPKKRCRLAVASRFGKKLELKYQLNLL